MTLRIHFTEVDFTRLVLASAHITPLRETALSLQQLQNRGSSPRFARWRRDVVRRRPQILGLLSELVPKTEWLPADLIVGNGAFEAEEATPETIHKLAETLYEWTANRRGPGWSIPTVDRGTNAHSAVFRALTEYHSIAITPFLRAIQAQLEAERADRSHLMTSRGIEALLTSLHPAARWNASVIELPSEANRDVYLRGRGLRLVAHYFSGPLPRLAAGADVPTLIYPAASAQLSAGLLTSNAPADETAARPLAAILGRTRTAVLQAVAETPGMTTSGLAERVGIAVASASEHATTLREAGLIASHRERAATLHSPTSLGTSLIDGAGAGHNLRSPKDRQHSKGQSARGKKTP
ncbi:ArsR/SmtB family transcription factor [Kitasatospora sp. NPDC059088]|uniref:ArsR/SmtB family transcription factor n=1 Tax=Kitasatospora sp. NPDC059088 TaxID=3346722 RepID=UPI0036CC05DE